VLKFYIDGGVLKAAGLEPGSFQDAKDKWLFLADHPGEVVGGQGIETCSLCLAYECRQCPVGLFTGAPGCMETPYPVYHHAVCSGDMDAQVRCAREMVALLEKIEKEFSCTSSTD